MLALSRAPVLHGSRAPSVSPVVALGAQGVALPTWLVVSEP